MFWNHWYLVNIFQAIAQLFTSLYWDSIETLLDHENQSLQSEWINRKKIGSVKNTCVGIMITNWKDLDQKLNAILGEMEKGQHNLIKCTHINEVYIRYL